MSDQILFKSLKPTVIHRKMGYLKERIKHAVRFRHKRGYGVHSPFMFNLILNVIRDPGETISISREVGERKLFESSGEKNFPAYYPVWYVRFGYIG